MIAAPLPAKTTTEKYLSILKGLRRLTRPHVLDVLERACLLELYNLQDGCDNPSECLLAATCPRAARQRRVRRGYILSRESGEYIHISKTVPYLLGVPEEEIYNRNAASFWANPRERFVLLNELHRNDVLRDYPVKVAHGSGLIFEYDVTVGLSRNRGEGVLEAVINPGSESGRVWRVRQARVIGGG